MRRAFLLTFAALAAPAAIAVPSIAIAQEQEQEQEQDGFSQFVDAIASDRISDLSFEADMRTAFGDLLKQDPDVAAAEAECPGYTKGFAEAVRPVMRKSHDYDWIWYRGGLLRIFQEGLQEHEARGAAEVFSSELGQRFLTVGIQVSAAEASMSDILGNEDGMVTEEAYRQDQGETVRRLTNALSPAELSEFETRLGSASWFPSMLRIQPQINALQLQRVNRDFTPEHGAEFDKVVARYVDSHFERCEKAK